MTYSYDRTKEAGSWELLENSQELVKDSRNQLQRAASGLGRVCKRLLEKQGFKVMTFDAGIDSDRLPNYSFTIEDTRLRKYEDAEEATREAIGWGGHFSRTSKTGVYGLYFEHGR